MAESPEYADRKHGYGLTGMKLDDFIMESSYKIRGIWSTIHNESGGELTLDDYRKAVSLGFFSRNIIRTAVLWNSFANQDKKEAAKDVLGYQFLKYSLSAIDLIVSKFPEAEIDPLTLMQEGFIFAWSNIENSAQNGFISSLRSRLSQNINRSVEIPLSSIRRKDLERAEFVAANLDTVVNPEERMERTDLMIRFRTVIKELTDRELIIIEKRYPQGDEKSTTHEELGREFGVTRERVRQIETKAIRKLAGRLNNREAFQEYRQERPKLEDQLRMYFNGIVNAYHLKDAPRAKHNLALAKVTLLAKHTRAYFPRNLVVQMLKDPLYPISSDEVLIKYLDRFTSQPKEVLNGIKEVEQGDDPTSQELRNFESIVHKTPN